MGVLLWECFCGSALVGVLLWECFCGSAFEGVLLWGLSSGGCVVEVVLWGSFEAEEEERGGGVGVAGTPPAPREGFRQTAAACSQRQGGRGGRRHTNVEPRGLYRNTSFIPRRFGG